MPKKKVAQHNTSTEKAQNAVTSVKTILLDEYLNYLTYNKEIFTTSTAERIARELIAWVRGDENALKISQFLESRGINKRTWHRWVEKYEIISEANDFALMVIGNRREIGLLTRKYDSASTTLSMLHYDSDWREMLATRAKLMAHEGLTSGQKIVVIEKYPDSPMVPVKKVVEE